MAALVAAQVDDERLHARAAQLLQRRPHQRRRLLGEHAHLDEPGAARQHHRRHRIDVERRALDRARDDVGVAQDGQRHRRAGLAAHRARRFVLGHALERLTVDLEDLVAHLHAGALGGRAGHDPVDVDDARRRIGRDVQAEPDHLAHEVGLDRRQLARREQLVPLPVADAVEQPRRRRAPQVVVADLVVDVLLLQHVARLAEGLLAVAERILGARRQRHGQQHQRDECERPFHRNAKFSGVVRAVSIV